MLISLHKQATTTPKIRAAIQVSTDPGWMVAERSGILEQTVCKWRERYSFHELKLTKTSWTNRSFEAHNKGGRVAAKG